MKVTTIPGEGRDAETVGYLIELWDAKSVLKFSDEYQRAPAWKTPQKQLFIDSIFREYSIPAFYFHKTGRTVRGLSGERYEVVDGQQRIRAIREFKNDDFPLLSPEDYKKLPPFLSGRDTKWDGCRYSELPPDMQKKFLDQPIVIYEMVTDNDNEVRDLFIRLQGGTALSAQDKRDTYPGELPTFVMQMGGKPPLNEGEIGRYRGHKFFNEFIKGGERNNRKLAAQLLLLTSHNARGGNISFCDINSRALDNFYLRSVGDFSPNCVVASRFKKNIDGICRTFSASALSPARKLTLASHEAIHLFLLVNSLSDGYVAGWEKNLPEALWQFRTNSKKAKGDDDYFMRYVRWVSQSSASASTIEMRHHFYMQEMLRLLSPTAKDPTRAFAVAEKEYIYLRDRGLCQWCRMKGKSDAVVQWDDAQFHHIIPHAEGGRTEPDNGALMHAKCHPRNPQPVGDFREWWEKEGKHAQYSVARNGAKRKISDLPESTKCRFEHEDIEYEGAISGGKLNMAGFDKKFASFKAASEAIVREKPVKNWWLEWDIQLPGMQEDEWMPADNWQPGK